MKKLVKQRNENRPKYNFWQNSAFMIQIAWKHCKSVIFICITCSLLYICTNLTELLITPIILNKIESSVPLSELLVTILGFAGILLVLNSLTPYVIQNAIFGRIKLDRVLNMQVTRQIATTSFPNTEDTDVLKKQDKATRQRNRALEFIWETLSGLLQHSICFVIYLCLISSLEPLLIGVILVTTITGYFINKRIYEWGFIHRDEEAALSSKMNYICQAAEDIKLGKDIRIFGMETWLQDIYKSTLRLLQAFLAKRERAYLRANLIDLIMILLRNGIAYFYLINLVLDNNLSASAFLLYFTAVSSFTAQITGIFSLLSTMHQQSMDISMLREYLEIPEPFSLDSGKPVEIQPDMAYEFRFQNVSFRYPGADKDTIHNLNLTIRPGENLAIVGLNGAGKTTFIKLLCGFYDPTEGEVLLNNTNIKEFNRREYYKLFSAVFQNYSLLEATIAQNISQSVAEFDREKLSECIRKADLEDTIQKLSAGINTYVGRHIYDEGIELSGGQTQRLLLARALYKDAPIIVLDEPTAALDPIAENNIYLKYNEMTAGKTSVFISHRLASTRFCDRILFLADGVIAEEGTHETLLAQKGQYAELFQVQSKYYQEGGSDKNEE